MWQDVEVRSTDPTRSVGVPETAADHPPRFPLPASRFPLPALPPPFEPFAPSRSISPRPPPHHGAVIIVPSFFPMTASRMLPFRLKSNTSTGI